MPKRLRRKGGFTLIEMLMVILIIGFLVGILAIRASDVGADAKKKAVAADLKSLKAAVEIYYVGYSCFPSNDANWESELVGATPRLIDEVPNDPFRQGNDYIYSRDDDGKALYVISSTGPNGATMIYCTGDAVIDTDEDDIWVSNCKTNNHGGF